MQTLKRKRLEVKVCGMKNVENIQQVSTLPLDLMGFIFYDQSKRFVGDLNPNRLPELKGIKKVGVFVNAKPTYILDQVSRFGLDMIQLHGDETPAFCSSLKRILGKVKLTKVFRVLESSDFSQAKDFVDYSDFFLFDTKGERYGGTGKSFDWNILDAYVAPVPFYLSGGIGPDALDALRKIDHPKLKGIDVNSGFEIEPGLKDAGLLTSFIEDFKKR